MRSPRVSLQLGGGKVADQHRGAHLPVALVEHVKQHGAPGGCVTDRHPHLVEYQQVSAGEQRKGFGLRALPARRVGVAKDPQGRGDGQEETRVARLDHLRQDRAGEVRLAGPGTAQEQQAAAAPTYLREAVRVGAADAQRLTLLRCPRQVALEGPVQEPPRNPAAPNGALELRLCRTAPVGGEARDLALANGGQFLSGGQRG
jgi:hypothetical protein